MSLIRLKDEQNWRAMDLRSMSNFVWFYNLEFLLKGRPQKFYLDETMGGLWKEINRRARRDNCPYCQTWLYEKDNLVDILESRQEQPKDNVVEVKFR